VPTVSNVELLGDHEGDTVIGATALVVESPRRPHHDVGRPL